MSGSCSQPSLGRLRSDYKSAFAGWAGEVARMRELAATDLLALADAAIKVDAAELVYRTSRNRLADKMSHAVEAE